VIYDKKLLRARYAEGSLDVVVSDELPEAASRHVGGEGVTMTVEKTI